MDECGFSPTQPSGYTWVRRGRRLKIPYEAPCGRRVNAIVAYAPFRNSGCLRFTVKPRTLTSIDVLKFLFTLPVGDVPCIVVLDNVGIHISKVIKDAIPRLRRHGLRLFYLPPYSPELNDVEAVLGVIKAHVLVERSYPTLERLLTSVRRAFRSYRSHLNKR